MSRVARLQESLPELGAEALLVSRPANVRYLSGFRSPEDGRVLLTGEGAWLITDGRYEAQAAEETELATVLRREWLPWVAEAVAGRRLAVESDHLSHAQYEDLSSALGQPPVAVRDLLRPARMVKDERERQALERAAAITDAAFEHALAVLAPGVSELEVALELERFMLRQGAEAKSFPIIVASGHRSAMPHGVASVKKLAAGELVTLDFGARVEGYHADMTRTVALGRAPHELRELYEAVLAAQRAALSGLRAGVTGREVDELARGVLERRGLAERFPHSLGHGVGLEIHEGPALSQRSDDLLEPGMVVTVEPGVYLPGTGGVRIEDLAVVTAEGCQVLSRSPKELLEL